MKIAVAGTGYVGLVAGVCFAEKGYDVTCVDVDEKKVEMMRQGISPIYEDGLEELMQKNNERGTLHYTTDYKAAYKDADEIAGFAKEAMAWANSKGLIQGADGKLLPTGTASRAEIISFTFTSSFSP